MRENNEKMSLEEFKKMCYEEDYNIVEAWDFKRFKVTCMDCGSDEIQLASEPREGAMGSEYTGWMSGFHSEGGLLVKCIKCGKAMSIGHYDLKSI